MQENAPRNTFKTAQNTPQNTSGKRGRPSKGRQRRKYQIYLYPSQIDFCNAVLSTKRRNTAYITDDKWSRDLFRFETGLDFCTKLAAYIMWRYGENKYLPNITEELQAILSQFTEEAAMRDGDEDAVHSEGYKELYHALSNDLKLNPRMTAPRDPSKPKKVKTAPHAIVQPAAPTQAPVTPQLAPKPQPMATRAQLAATTTLATTPATSSTQPPAKTSAKKFKVIDCPDTPDPTEFPTGDDYEACLIAFLDLTSVYHKALHGVEDGVSNAADLVDAYMKHREAYIHYAGTLKEFIPA